MALIYTIPTNVTVASNATVASNQYYTVNVDSAVTIDRRSWSYPYLNTREDFEAKILNLEQYIKELHKYYEDKLREMRGTRILPGTEERSEFFTRRKFRLED